MTPEQIKLADAVAALLKLPPAPGCDGHWARIYSLPDGGRLCVSSGRSRGHLHISTSLADNLREHRPYYRDGEAPKTSINVSDSKPAARIAVEICRRLVPEHEREESESAARKAKHDEHNAQRVLALTKVAVPFGERIRCDERSGEPCPLRIDRDGKFSLQAKPFCESLKLEIETASDIAGRIASLLAAL